MDDTDWQVVLKQGRYWRKDAQKYMTDAEYEQFQLLEKAEAQ